MSTSNPEFAARGREADRPQQIPAKGWKDILFRVKDRVSEDRVGLVAAGIAFYGLLALFPAITAVLALGGLILDPSQIISQISGLSGIVPQAAIDIITTQAEEVAGSSESGLGLAAILGLLLALYSASKGMGSLMEGLNVAYDEEEERGFFSLKARTLALTLLLIFGVLVGLAALIVLPVALSVLSFAPWLESLGSAVGVLLLVALTLFGLAIVYRYGPDRDPAEWAWLSPGAIVATLAWIAGSAGFALYVANFGSYNESFGAIAGVIILLMWLWISAYVILVGAQLNAEMEAQTRHDTTIGADRPMGRRDAEKADHLGETQSA